MDGEELLRFWFGRDSRAWFEKNPAFDAEIRARFLALYEAAARAELETWKGEPRSCLALVILLDQFPRNMFRDSARAFSTDHLALEAARHAVAAGYDRGMAEVERAFVYLPFEHSENLTEQERALELFAGHPDFEWARRHAQIIRRFGRFPHRNAVLGRQSTPAEIEFLKQPGSGF